MSNKLKIPLPPSDWWRKIDPVYWALLGLVLIVGKSGETTSIPYLIFALAVAILILGHSWLKREPK